MDRFPNEFSDLLNRRGRKLLADPPKLDALIAEKRTPILLLNGLIDDGVSRECMRLLDETLYGHLKKMYVAIPREALMGLKENYTEELPKNMHVQTCYLNKGTKTHRAAAEIGLPQMMTSKSFREFAQAFTNAPLRENFWGRQVICYERGDYSGPHNDHHPENEEERNGFIDLHIMFSNDAVAQQLLVYEDRGYLTNAHDITARGAVAIYRLPFWHYTTPLMARKGKESQARRWLLLGSFAYDPPLAKLEY